MRERKENFPMAQGTEDQSRPVTSQEEQQMEVYKDAATRMVGN